MKYFRLVSRFNNLFLIVKLKMHSYASDARRKGPRWSFLDAEARWNRFGNRKDQKIVAPSSRQYADMTIKYDRSFFPSVWFAINRSTISMQVPTDGIPPSFSFLSTPPLAVVLDSLKHIWDSCETIHTVPFRGISSVFVSFPSNRKFMPLNCGWRVWGFNEPTCTAQIKIWRLLNIYSI